MSHSYFSVTKDFNFLTLSRTIMIMLSLRSRQHLHHVLKLIWWESFVWETWHCWMCQINMQELLVNWFNARAVIARCFSEGNTFIMPWNWFDERAVFNNLTLMNVLHYACEWKVCLKIDSMNEQCLTTQLCECTVILMQMKELLKNWSDERTVFEMK